MQREKKTCETSIIIYRERERGGERARELRARVLVPRREFPNEGEDEKKIGRAKEERIWRKIVRIGFFRTGRVGKTKEEGKRKGGEKGRLNALVVDG